MWSYSAFTCDAFSSFHARAPGVPPNVAQARAQEWADGLSSSPGCKLQSAQAISGVGKAHYGEPAPFVAPALAVISGTLIVAAALLSQLAWSRGRHDERRATTHR